MKFGKELKSQMVPEWQEAYMDYEYLKVILKDVHHFKQRNRPSTASNPPGLTRKLTLYRAFSGLVQQRFAESPTGINDVGDIENHPILVSSVERSDGKEGYETNFLMTEEKGGEYELVFFRRLDDEFNKVVCFYKAKVEEVVKEAAMLNTQMDALIAFRIKVDKPHHSWFHSTPEMTTTDRIVSAVTASVATLSGSKSSGIGGVSRRAMDHMEIIDEDRSVRRVQSDISTSNYVKQAESSNLNFVQQLMSNSKTKTKNEREINRPAPVEILDRVTINKPVETPRSTIKGILNIPIQTELKFSNENLNKLEDQLKIAFIEFYHKLSLLKNYSFLNISAFSKIMKKYDKVASRDASRSYMEMVDRSYIGSSDEVTKLMERVEAEFIKHFASSNRKKGISTLRPKPKRDTHALTASVGFLAGCTLALIVALILMIHTRHLLEKDGGSKYMETMFPLYSLFAFVVLHVILYAGNLYFWRRYRVNYPFIFGFKPATALGYRQVLLLSFGLAVLALGSILANLDLEMDPETGDYKAITELLPLGLVLLVVVIMICPFNIIYRSSRFFLLSCLFHIVCAPLYKVVLSDFLLADQLTSQVQAFRSLEFYICYYTSGDYRHRENSCNINDVYRTFNFIVAAIPFWFRLLQCLRRVVEEKDGMQGWNALKYFSTLVAVTTRTAYTRSESNEWKIIAWITSGIAAVASTYWDLVMDWGLLQRNSVNPWLRDKLLVPYKSVYFGAMVLNVLLRLAWVQTVLDFKVSFLHKESLITIVASLEIVRRGIWNFFRLENEHLYNVGKYRAFNSVPLPFNYDEDRS